MIFHELKPLSNAFIDTSGFCGRKQELEQLKASVENQDHKIILIHGVAGIGKSCLVAKYVSRCQVYEPNRILLIDCKKYNNIIDIYRRIGDLFEYTDQRCRFADLLKDFPKQARDPEYSDISQKIIEVLPKCLIIFENFEVFLIDRKDWDKDEPDIENNIFEITSSKIRTFFKCLLKSNQNAKIIITSRYKATLIENQSGFHRLHDIKLQGLNSVELKEYASTISKYEFSDSIWELIEHKINGHPQAFGFLCSLFEGRQESAADLPIYTAQDKTGFQVKAALHLLKKVYDLTTDQEKEILLLISVLREPFSEDMARFLLSADKKTCVALFDRLKSLENLGLLTRVVQNGFADCVKQWTPDSLVKDFLQLMSKKKGKYKDANILAARFYENKAQKNFRKLSDADFFIQAGYHYKNADNAGKHWAVFDSISYVLTNTGYMNYLNGMLEESEENVKLRIEKEPQNGLLYFYLGRILKEKGDYEAAIQTFEQSLRLADDDEQRSITLQNYAICLKRKGDYEEAGKKFEESLKLDPKNSKTLHGYAVCLKDKGDYESAIEKFEQSLKLYPKNAKTLNAYAVCLKANGNYENAGKKLEESLKLDPENTIALNGYGVHLKEKGDYEAAIEKFEQSLKLYPENAITLNAYAICLKEKGDYKAACENFEESLKFEPGQAITLHAYAICLKENKNYEAAIEKFEHCLKLDPDSPITLNAYAVCLKEKGDYKAAIQKFEHCLKLEPDNPKNLNAYAVCLKEKGDYKAAFQKFEQCLRLKTDDKQKTKTLQAYAICLKENGNYKAAIEKFEQCLKLNTDDKQKTKTLQAYAICLKESRDYKGAIEKFEQCLKLDTGDKQKTKTLQAYAICLKKIRDYKGAIEKFEHCLKLAPYGATILNAYAVCLKEKGDYQAAIEKFEESLKLDTNDRQKVITLNSYAVCLKQNNDYEAAIQKFEESLKADSENTITLNAYAICLKEKGDYKGAIEKFEESLKLDHDGKHKAMTLHAYAICLKEMGDYETTHEKFEQALKLNPYNTIILCSYAVYLKESRDYENAIEKFELALKLAVNDRQKAKTMLSYALCLKDKRDYKRAIEMFEQCLELNPDKVNTLLAYALCLKDNRDYKGAIEKLEQALKLAPDHSKTLQTYAVCLNKTRNFQKAENIFKQISLDKLDNISRTEYARLKILMHKYRQALDILEQINPKDEYVYQETAFVAGKLHKYDQKEEILKQGLKEFPDNRFLLQHLAGCFSIKSRSETDYKQKQIWFNLAKEQYEKGIKFQVADVRFYCHYASFFQRNGKYHEAEIQYKKALSLDDSDSETHTELGNMLRFRTSRHKEARFHLKKAIELNHKNYKSYLYYAFFLYRNREFEESEQYYKLAVENCPLHLRDKIQRDYELEKRKF
jgi:tetratricopeptide (TPR) repeat protein